MHEAAVGRPDQLRPVLVDVLSEGGGGLEDLAVYRQLEQIVELLGLQAPG